MSSFVSSIVVTIQGQYSEAIPLFERSLILESVLEPHDPTVVTALNNLVQVYDAQVSTVAVATWRLPGQSLVAVA